MHFNFDFSTRQILWTLSFAALLVLIVVLLGRDRARRFPFFTSSIVLMALLLLMEQLLLDKMSRIAGSATSAGLSDLYVLVSLAVLVELARRAFQGAARLAWLIAALVMLAVAAVVLWRWGQWPAWKTLTASSEMATLQLMSLVVEKVNLLDNVLAIELGLLVALLGRRFNAGWRSHTQQIVIGLSTIAIGQITLQATLQTIWIHTHITSRAMGEHLMGLRDKLVHANNVVYICVLVWWIACLWRDEPGTPSAAAAPAETATVADESVTQESEPDEKSEAGSAEATEERQTAEQHTESSADHSQG